MNKVYLWDNGGPFAVEQEFGIGPFTVLFGKNNAGKTSILDQIYLMLATRPPGAGEARLRGVLGGDEDPGEEQIGMAPGAIYVELEPDLEFDHGVLESFPRWEPVKEGAVRFGPLPHRQVCYGAVVEGLPPRPPELWFTDLSEFYREILSKIVDGSWKGFDYELDEQQRRTPKRRSRTPERSSLRPTSPGGNGPFPEPLFLGWEFHEIDTLVTEAIAEITLLIRNRHGVMNAPLEVIDSEEDAGFKTYRLRPSVERAVGQLALLATDLLPDFLEGEIQTRFSMPFAWDDHPRVQLYYVAPGRDRRGRRLTDVGRGASRWLGIAVQLALRIMEDDTETTSLDSVGYRQFSGHVLFIDEPEAHLHHSAVASIVRWCRRMVRSGFNVLAASHHEEFLRAPGEDVTFVEVARREVVDRDGARVWSTTARTITTAATSTLQELADGVGMHPSVALSLYRAILFVEGPLDEAVLDEYAGPALDAAGVTIIPIHGTRNLEGLIDGEFTTRLGIKTGVLTDNTITGTIANRSNKKRSSEEKKLLRLIKRFDDQGLPPPDLFGVAEDDLLFALPPEAIREYLRGPFPGWHELRAECRVAEGRGPSDSVDWKSYAEKHYGLPITTADGVRRIVRALDLAGVELASVRTVVDEIISWAHDT